MRNLIFAIGAVLAFGGCSDNGGGMPQPDLSMSTQDLSMSNMTDMAMGTKTGCAGLRMCANACAGDSTCITKCRANSTSMAKSLQATYQQCAFRDCNMPPDGGAVRCSGPTDTSMDCNTCFNNSLHGGNTGIACNPVDDPNCGHCSAQLKACLDDLP